MARPKAKSRREERRMAVRVFCPAALDDRVVRLMQAAGLELLKISRRLGLSLRRRDADARLSHFVLLSLVVAFFGGDRLRSRQQAARRWCVKLRGRQRRKVGRHWCVASEARLPDGSTVAAFARARGLTEVYPTLSVDWQWWAPKDLERTCHTGEVLRRFDRFRAQQPHLTAAQAAKGFAASEDGKWAAERGLCCSYASLRRYGDRLNRDGNIDRRGRGRRRSTKGRKGGTPR